MSGIHGKLSVIGQSALYRLNDTFGAGYSFDMGKISGS